MGKLIVSVVLAVIGICLTAPGEAQAADWTLRIDNWGNPDHPASWATNDTILVEIHFVNSNGYNAFTLRQVPDEDVVAGAHDILVDNSSIPLSSVTFIRIFTSGSDLFVIDELEVLDTSGNRYFAAGIDNMVGYCFSNDPNDYSTNAHCLNQEGGASRSWYF